MNAKTPPDREQLAAVAAQCIEAGEFHKAFSACQRLNREFPDYPYGWYLASFVMKKVRHHADAVKAIDRALQLCYTHRYQMHRAKCLFDSGDRAGAMEAVGEMRSASFDDPWLHNELGSLLHLLGDQSGALAQYSRATELDDRIAEFHFNKAAVQRYLGDAAGSEVSFDAVLHLKPHEFEAYTGRSQLRTQTRERNHVPQLQDVLGCTSSSAGRVQLHYALAKELEDIGDHENAFDHLKQGSDTKRRGMQYNNDTDLQIIAKICESYGAEMFDGHIRGCASAEPIFIIGMPRTGTTLVERILASHSSVFAAGELNTFSLELMRLVKASPSPAPASRLDFVAKSAQVDFLALGESYINSTRPMRDTSPHFIDKLPFNYLYAGLIHLALPRAKIINLQRHPMDTCYAVYKQLFKDAYPFSYDLDELGQYYVAYHRLMQHWNEVMPGVMYTLRYEAVVADIEGEARRLLEYCGLLWEDQCLRFYEDTQASTTASAIQVRQPVYDTSLGKWRHYSRQLESLRMYLEGAGIDCG